MSTNFYISSSPFLFYSFLPPRFIAYGDPNEKLALLAPKGLNIDMPLLFCVDFLFFLNSQIYCSVQNLSLRTAIVPGPTRILGARVLAGVIDIFFDDFKLAPKFSLVPLTKLAPNVL